MKLTDVLNVKFRHENNRDTLKGSTTCRIYRGEEEVGVGVATTHHTDTFCRKTGRKVALKKAVEALAATLPDKEARRTLWNEVLNPQEAEVQAIA